MEKRKHIRVYEETVYIHLKNKIAQITPTKWDDDFDPDTIFEIDPYNIMGELITIPVLVSRLGIFVAQMNGLVKKQKAGLKVEEAEESKIFRKEESVEGRKKPTVQEVEDHLTLFPVISNLRLKLIKMEAELQKIEVLYDVAQKKSFNIGILGRNLVPSEFEKDLIEGKINGVMIHMKDKQYS